MNDGADMCRCGCNADACQCDLCVRMNDSADKGRCRCKRMHASAIYADDRRCVQMCASEDAQEYVPLRMCNVTFGVVQRCMCVFFVYSNISVCRDFFGEKCGIVIFFQILK